MSSLDIRKFDKLISDQCNPEGPQTMLAQVWQISELDPLSYFLVILKALGAGELCLITCSFLRSSYVLKG